MSLVTEFNDYRAKMNEKILAGDNKVIKRIFNLDTNAPWTTISYGIYGTIFLWWMITELNNITNPIDIPKPGTIIKYIKPEYVKQIVGQINNQSNG